MELSVFSEFFMTQDGVQMRMKFFLPYQTLSLLVFSVYLGCKIQYTFKLTLTKTSYKFYLKWSWKCLGEILTVSRIKKKKTTPKTT